MLFTQIKSDEVKGPHINHVKCSQCSKTGFHLRGKIKYLALELINMPMFIFNRQYEFKCSCGHCQAPCVKPKQLKALKRQMLPWSYYATKHVGILVFMIMIAWLYRGYLQSGQVERALVENPKVNDFYFIDYFGHDNKTHPKYRYTVLKAVEINDDKVTLQVGNIFKSRQGNARDQIKSDRAMLDGFFSTKTITLTQAQMKAYFNSDIIYEVRRPENLQIDGWIVIPESRPKKYVYQVNLDNQQGIALYRGEDGYYRDYVGAFEAFTRAALADNAAGQNNLAEMYRDGLGTEVDHQKALYWFKRAAEQLYLQADEQYNQLCLQVIDCQSI